MQDKPASVGQQIVFLARGYTASLNAQLHPLGLTAAQFQVLRALEKEGEQTQRSLADSLGVEQATMAATLSRMRRDGLVTRRAHPDDGRAQLQCLTRSAHDLLEPALAAHSRTDQALLSGLPVAEQALFASMLARMSAAIAQNPVTEVDTDADHADGKIAR